MRTPAVALAFLGFLAGPLAAQDFEWVEVRFHRVYLRNGNFIDGSMTRQNEDHISLKMKSGDMVIKHEQIDRIELVKLRSVSEKPKALAKPAAVKTAMQAPLIRVPIQLTPAALQIRETVVRFVDEYRKTAPEFRYLLMRKILETGQDSGTVLVSLLEDPEPEIRGYIAEILLLLKDRQALPALREMLATSHRELRPQILEIATTTGDRSALEWIRPLLRDEDPAVRTGALRSILSFEDTDSFEGVLSRCNDEDRGVRSSAILATLQFSRKLDRADATCRDLGRMAGRAEGELRAELIQAVGKTASNEAFPILITAMSDSSPLVRAQAIQQLATLGGDEAIRAVLDCLPGERETRPRVQLAIASKKLKILAAVGPLINWLADQDANVVAGAADALRSLTGRDFGTDFTQWSNWWNQTQTRK